MAEPGKPRPKRAADGGDAIRINLWLARKLGISRRGADALVADKRVHVNGQVAVAGMAVGHGDQVLYDGRVLTPPKLTGKLLAFIYHKPLGVICSQRDECGRPLARECALEALSRELSTSPSSSRQGLSWLALSRQRWMMVGRLDVNSSGLLIFVNDGKLCSRLMHPSSQIDRIYRVRVNGALDPAAISALQTGVELDGKLARLDSLKAIGSAGQGQNRWYEVRLHEGLNREIRRLFEHVGCRVSKLTRTHYGKLALGRLNIGDARLLNNAQAKSLMGPPPP